MYSFEILEERRADEVLRLIGRAVERLEALGIHQWDEIYPDEGTIRNDLAERTMRALFVETALAGILVLNERQDAEYADVPWELDDRKPLVLHRICLDPAWQGKGLSKLMMNYVDDHGRKSGYRSLRFDAFAENPISLGLYRSLGYSPRGTVRFRKGLFWCFERVF
jgi:GNAT superfamily N-acetyltransferase